MKLPKRTWKASWIGHNSQAAGTNLRAVFAKSLQINASETGGLELYISARDRYFVYINGRLVGEGPPMSPEWAYYYDRYCLDDHLQVGVNDIRVVVHRLGEPVAGRPLLLAEIAAPGGEVLCQTDQQWLVKEPLSWEPESFHFAMQVLSPFQEIFRAAVNPLDEPVPSGAGNNGWLCATKVASSTSNQALADGIILLSERDIPHLEYGSTAVQSICRVEESLELIHRARAGDVSVALSMPGNPMRFSRAENVDGLLEPGGGGRPVVLQCGLPDRRFKMAEPDGRYNPCLTLDFGSIANGFIEFEVEAEDKAQLLIGFAERLVDGYLQIAHECPFAVSYTTKVGWQRWRSSDFRTFRYVRIRLQGTDAPVRILRFHRVDWSYPFAQTGSFSCSDNSITQLFQACEKSMRLCSMEALMDTPWREGAQWLGDIAAVTLGGLYSTFGEVRLPSKFFRQTLATQRPDGTISSMSNQPNLNRVTSYPDYSLWWVFAGWQHYCYTGDPYWRETLYPAVLRVFQFLEQYERPGGLIDNLGVNWFIDHADVDKRGCCAAGNAIYYMGLGVLQEWAHVRGDRFWEAHARQRRESICTAFSELFWNAKRQLFHDSFYHGRRSDSLSEHANLAAIAFGLASEEQSQAIIRQLYGAAFPTDVVECEPFFASVVLRAFEKLNRHDLALQVIRERWVGRQINRGAETVWEEWGLNGSWRRGSFSPVMRTASHAWGAYPAEYLTRGMLGVSFLDPGKINPPQPLARPDFDFELKLPIRGQLISAHYQRGDAQVSCTIEPADEWSTATGQVNLSR